MAELRKRRSTMGERKTDWVKIILIMIVCFGVGWGVSNLTLKSTPEEAPQQEAVASQTLAEGLTSQQQQLPTFTDDSGMVWTIVDTIWAEFSDYKFLQGLIVRNTEGQQATLNQDANLLFLIALANSSDPGIWEVLDAYGVQISDINRRQLYPVIIP